MAQSVRARCAERLWLGVGYRLAGVGLMGVLVGAPAAAAASAAAVSAATATTSMAASYGIGREMSNMQLVSAMSVSASTLQAQPADPTSQVANADPVAGVVPITVTVPGIGLFAVTTDAGAVTLEGPNFPGHTATGTLQAVMVSDTRSSRPGWSVSAEVSDFAGSGAAAGQTISADHLGWAPAGTLATGAVLGPAIAASSPGLGSPALLAFARTGDGAGTSTLSADLTLDVPAGSKDGPYTATMTITFVVSGP